MLGARLQGVVLRYGCLDGPGSGLSDIVSWTSSSVPEASRRGRRAAASGPWVHVDDAAAVTVAAVEG